jgi:hypothetical protein
MTLRHALALTLALSATQALAGEGRDVPLAPVCDGVTKAKPADPEDIIHVKMVAKPKDQPELPPDLALELVKDGKATPIALDADHGFDPRCDEPSMREASIRVNQPRDKVRFGLAFPARVPTGTAMSYAKLAESVPVMIEAIRRQAGLLRFLAPKVRGIRLTFAAEGQHVTIRLPDGVKRFDADARGVVVLPWNPDWSTATVQLSEPLSAITPELH